MKERACQANVLHHGPVLQMKPIIELIVSCFVLLRQHQLAAVCVIATYSDIEDLL